MFNKFIHVDFIYTTFINKLLYGFFFLKILNIIKYFLYFIIAFLIFELISIDTKYINKPNFTFDVGNVRNPQAKKIVRFIDNIGGEIYFNISKNKKEFNDLNIEKYKNYLKKY